MNDYPLPLVAVGHSEPVPRRIRGVLAAETIFDTTRARYVWEWPPYPQYYIPLEDVRRDLLVDEGHAKDTRLGQAAVHSLRVGEVTRPGAAWMPAAPELSGTVRFEWGALDAWFEEDEEVFVHARSPFWRVDAIRSRRSVRVELDGVLLAQTRAPVMVFETGLPTRYYIDRTEVDFTHLIPSDTVTSCAYKGTTGDYWSVRAGEEIHPDLAWSYRFPTRELNPIAGMVAFYNEKVDITLDGRPLPRPEARYS
jgi:uncharacterized protein (DUF427 family)